MRQPPDYSILWTSPAKADLFELVTYIAGESLQAAERCMKKLEDGVEKLAWSPARGRIVPELAAYGCQEYREIIIKPWRIVFKIDANNVYIMMVIDSRRNVEELLLSKLLRPSSGSPGSWGGHTAT